MSIRRGERRKVFWLRPVGGAERAEQPCPVEEGISLVRVHPMPQSPTEILSVAAHLVRRFAAEQGREVPGFSVEAANFLSRQSWELDDLVRRVGRAVAANQGNLITASDLSD